MALKGEDDKRWAFFAVRAGRILDSYIPAAQRGYQTSRSLMQIERQYSPISGSAVLLWDGV